jgi:Zn-dependent protease with chaperone function
MNPTAAIDLDFPAFISRREESSRQHFDGKTTDYCFSLDLKMRKRLAAIKPLVLASKSILSVTLAIQKQLLAMQGVMVGPQQYPEIYKMAQDNAEILGIGIPQIYILYHPIINAYTLATEEAGDMIVIHSALVEACTPSELKFIVGHECGHIHNLHSVFNNIGISMKSAVLQTLARKIPGGAAVLALLEGGLGLFLNSWSRCAEASSDRAGLICCGDLDTARYALAKLSTGGGDNLRNINVDEYVKQLETTQNTPVRLYEAVMSHPIVTKRLAMLRVFRQCDVLFSWRPEMRNDQPSISRSIADQQCEQIASVFFRGGKN